MIRQGKADLCVHLSELQAYVRLETGDEEALLAGLLRTASELCERYINQTLLTRTFEQDLRATRGWTLIGLQPVRSLSEVRLADGSLVSPSEYKVDIDHDGRAYVSGLRCGETYRVSGVSGMAEDANGIPEPLRQGITRLTASLFNNRDQAAGELPPVVTALWRPYRRAGLCR